MAPSTTEEPIPCSTPPSKPPPSAYDEILTVTVDTPGSVVKTFQVYRGVLCHYSDYFRALLNGGWKDSAGNISLDDVSPKIFGFFFYRLNTGELSPIDRDHTDIWDIILRSYHFADFYMIQGFASRVLDLFISTLITEWKISLDILVAIYDNTPESSMLRKVLAKFLFETSDMAVTPEQRKVFPSEILWDIIEVSRKEKSGLDCFSLVWVNKPRYIRAKKEYFCKFYHDHPKLEDRPVITQEQRDSFAAK
jgi:hypothetical protein